jgi:hypothetical protein
MKLLPCDTPYSKYRMVAFTRSPKGDGPLPRFIWYATDTPFRPLRGKPRLPENGTKHARRRLNVLAIQPSDVAPRSGPPAARKSVMKSLCPCLFTVATHCQRANLNGGSL